MRRKGVRGWAAHLNAAARGAGERAAAEVRATQHALLHNLQPREEQAGLGGRRGTELRCTRGMVEALAGAVPENKRRIESAEYLHNAHH